MRTSLLLLAGCGLLVGTGCTQPSPPPPAAPANAAAPLGATPATASALVLPAVSALHVYVEVRHNGAAAAPLEANDHARTVSLSLGELLRKQGYDVRSAEAAAPASEAGRSAAALATAIAAGQPAPETSRAVTYLRPNAPSLLLFVHLDETAAATEKTELVLGAFLADSATGTILWSNRVTLRPPASDSTLRLLAARLVENLPARPPA